MRIGIVDYGASNLRSVLNAVVKAGGEPSIVRTPEEIRRADRLILPGVGAAAPAMRALRAHSIDAALKDAVVHQGRPLLGICLGMELLAEWLHEFEKCQGLGWMRGEVVHVREVVPATMRVPHMGWNDVVPGAAAGPMFDGIRSEKKFYFAHSYTLVRHDPAIVAASASYGADIVAAVRFGTVFATQFHPEKSQITGERLIRNFLSWSP